MLLLAAITAALALPPSTEIGPKFGQNCDLRGTHRETIWVGIPRFYQVFSKVVCDCVVTREYAGYVAHQVGPFFPHGDAWLEDERVSQTSVYVDGVRLMRPGMLY